MHSAAGNIDGPHMERFELHFTLVLAAFPGGKVQVGPARLTVLCHCWFAGLLKNAWLAW
jgi:hypothetical protein